MVAFIQQPETALLCHRVCLCSREVEQAIPPLGVEATENHPRRGLFCSHHHIQTGSVSLSLALLRLTPDEMMAVPVYLSHRRRQLCSHRLTTSTSTRKMRCRKN